MQEAGERERPGRGRGERLLLKLVTLTVDAYLK